MNRRFILPIICIAVISLTTAAAEPVAVSDAQTPASASDWPKFAGPDGNYTSPEKGLLHEWPAEGPQELWRAKIGTGWSCPSIAGEEVYVGSTEWSSKWEEGEKETTVCLDTKTGKELWRYVYDTKTHYQSGHVNIGWHWGGPRSTPTVTEKYVYSIGLIGHLVCLDRKTHQVVWEADLNKTYWPGPYVEWKGVNFSPAVDEGVLLVPFCIGDRALSRCAALDAETGKFKWVYPPDTTLPLAKGQNPTGAGFVTIGKDRCAYFGENTDGKSTVVNHAIRLSDGKPVWEYSWDTKKNPDGGPYQVDRAMLMAEGTSLFSVDVDLKTAPDQSKVTWVTHGLFSTYSGCLAHGDGIFGFFGGGDANDLTKWGLSLICLDRATGKKMWEEKGFKSGVSMIAADGLLFARSFHSLYLIEASLKGYTLKGKIEKLHDVTNAQGKDGDWVMPVLSRGQLYIRTPNELICYKVK